MSTLTPRADADYPASIYLHTACDFGGFMHELTNERKRTIDLSRELTKERARLDAMVANCWVVHSEVGGSFSVFSGACGDYIATEQTYRAAIDAAMKEGSA